jgi:hypothetical protein
LRAAWTLLLVETIFDSLNAKAALVAIREVFDEDGPGGQELPVMISAAVGRGGETMISAQTIEAFWNAVEHAKPLSVGLNCSLGPDLMYPFLESFRRRRAWRSRAIRMRGCRIRCRRRASIWGRRTWRVTWASLRGRADQYCRRLLRQYAGAYCGDCQGAGGREWLRAKSAGLGRPAENPQKAVGR